MKKIFVGTDFSKEAEIALRQAIDVARHTGGDVTLLHAGVVHERALQDAGQATVQMETYEKVLADCLAEDRRKLDELRERFDGQGVNISHAVVDGFADEALVDGAEDAGAELLVVGTHGRTGLKRFLLGSIAERVVRLAKIPVLVARPGRKSSGGFAKILVPTDFSTSSRNALDVAVALAAEGGTIDVLHCWNLPALTEAYTLPTNLRDEAVGPLIRDMDKELSRKAQEFIEGVGNDQVTVGCDVVRDHPANGIHDRAPGYDLICMGSHGRRGISRFLLGSVAEVTVRHAPCSVLVVGPSPE